MPENSDSILTTIKSMLGITSDYREFDEQVKMSINAAFTYLNQLGLGPDEGFRITGDTETWDDFIADEDRTRLEAVRSYVYFRTRLIFDPPTNAFLVDAIKTQITELEWRLAVMMDSIHTPDQE